MRSETEIGALVADEVKRARMSLPSVASYDPHGEGYRPLIGQQGQRRDLRAIDSDRMMDVAYWMWDHSAMTRGMAVMDKAFLFAEPVVVVSDDEDVQEIIDRFWKSNKMDLRLPGRMVWRRLLGNP